VHEKKPWLLAKHVTVQGSYGDAVAQQGLDRGINFFADQNKIAGDGGFAVASGLEVDGGGDAHGVGDLHGAIHDFAGPRDRDLVHAAVVLAGVPENGIDLFRIDADFRRGGGRRCRRWCSGD